MFRRNLCLAIEQTIFTPEARIVGNVLCLINNRINKKEKVVDGMINYIFDAVKNSLLNAMLSKAPNMTMKMMGVKDEEIKEETKQEEVKEEEPKEEVKEEVEEIKEETKQEEVKEEQKIDEIDMLIQYAHQIEDEMIMNEDIEDLLTDPSLLDKYNVEEMYDDYDYVDERDFSKEAQILHSIVDECEEEVVDEAVCDEVAEKINNTMTWVSNLMNNTGGNVEELFKKCEENKEEIKNDK